MAANAVPVNNCQKLTNFDHGTRDVPLGYKMNPAWGIEACCTLEIYGQNTAAGATGSLVVTCQLR